MTEEVVAGWPAVFPHLRYEKPGEAVVWLSRVFGFRERVRLAGPEGTVHISELEGPGGGLVMVAGLDPDFTAWMRARVPELREQRERPWPYLTHSITAMVPDVNAHYDRAQAEGATILMPPTNHPWGTRSYAALDLEGHQWQFGQTLRIVPPEDWGAIRVS